MEEKALVPIGLVVGFFVGKNWVKIKKKSDSYIEILTKKIAYGVEEIKSFFSEQKKKMAVAEEPEDFSKKQKEVTSSKFEQPIKEQPEKMVEEVEETKKILYEQSLKDEIEKTKDFLRTKKENIKKKVFKGKKREAIS